MKLKKVNAIFDAAPSVLLDLKLFAVTRSRCFEECNHRY